MARLLKIPRHIDDGDAFVSVEHQELYDQALSGVKAGPFAPLRDHSGLRHREGEKRTNGEERNETAGDSAEDDQQEPGKNRERPDSESVDEARVFNVTRFFLTEFTAVCYI